ncbi:MAG: UDP-2,3-diacylglucosamine diphosphatase [Xanthomonadales bacterium]|nr:UDP-2,3-diacylglucosamine diphosphatase [Xanthomonadales bacterium]
MPLNVRAVFISDVHLGFSGCSAEFLTDFLGRLRCDVIYLVGDIIDFINLRKRPEWVASHSMVIEKLLEMTRSGTRVIYVPGNHDEALRHYVGLKIGLLEIHDQFIHTTADQRRILVTHGDQFDSVVRCSPLLALIGTWVYDGLLKVNGWLNWCRQKSGREYWSLATFVKTRVRNAMEYIDRFEQAVMAFAHKENVDGVICGHIHRAEIRHGKGLTYMNCGDWVESCTALVEHRDGRIELLQWREKAKSLKADQVPMNEPDLQGRAA